MNKYRTKWIPFTKTISYEIVLKWKFRRIKQKIRVAHTHNFEIQCVFVWMCSCMCVICLRVWTFLLLFYFVSLSELATLCDSICFRRKNLIVCIDTLKRHKQLHFMFRISNKQNRNRQFKIKTLFRCKTIQIVTGFCESSSM